MRVLETPVYHYAELSPAAQEKAREWWRAGLTECSSFSEHVIEDAARVASILGIEFDESRNDKSPAVYWSGFWCQGDGASFTGRYSYAKGAPAAIRTYAPQDAELHGIADDLQRLQRQYFYGLCARITTSDNYCHAYTMRADVDHARDEARDISSAEDRLLQLMRDFANWIYRQLEAEYDYQTSDENVAENIEANEYEFTENGAIA